MKNNHSITEVLVHFVFVTKWRANYLFTYEDVERFRFLCLQFRCEPVEINFAANHFHLLVELHSSISVSDFACKIKSLFSGWYGKKCLFWLGFQNGYYACSVGKSSRIMIEQYIINQ